MEIPEIGSMIREIKIRSEEIKIAEIRPWETRSPVVNLIELNPVTSQIGQPIVDVPGCVEARQSNNMKLLEDDPKGNLVLCDGSVPYFKPIQFEPEVILETPKQKIDTRLKEKPGFNTNVIDKIPKIESPTPTLSDNEVECPTQEIVYEQPIGLILDSGRKEVTGYRLEGTRCIVETKDVAIIKQAINSLPPTGAVVTTASIAMVATTSALMAKPLAEILLKIIKPVIKKVIRKIAFIQGKTVKVESVKERRDAQRDRVNAIHSLRSALKK